MIFYYTAKRGGKWLAAEVDMPEASIRRVVSNAEVVEVGDDTTLRLVFNGLKLYAHSVLIPDFGGDRFDAVNREWGTVQHYRN